MKDKIKEKLGCVIVDDDRVSQAIIEELAVRTGFLRIEASFTDPVQAAKWLSANPTDVVFLDVEMPEVSGLDLLETLNHKPQVIIISSKPQYAVDAISFEVSSYLLKPIDDFSKFLKATLKAKDRIEKANKDQHPTDKIFIKVDSLFTNLSFSEIAWIEALGDYVQIKAGDKTLTIYHTMKAVEERLPPETFIRVHRSFIVNVDKISNLDQTNLEIAGRIIPIGNTYRQSLMQRIKTL